MHKGGLSGNAWWFFLNPLLSFTKTVQASTKDSFKLRSKSRKIEAAALKARIKEAKEKLKKTEKELEDMTPKQDGEGD